MGVVVMDNGIGGCQAETAARLFGGDIGLENAIQICWGGADAFIVKGNPLVVSSIKTVYRVVGKRCIL